MDNEKFRTDFDTAGSCNYAFPVILKKADYKFRNIFERKLMRYGIEFRRGNAGGGNQLRQPYLKSYLKHIPINFKEKKILRDNDSKKFYSEINKNLKSKKSRYIITSGGGC